MNNKLLQLNKIMQILLKLKMIQLTTGKLFL